MKAILYHSFFLHRLLHLLVHVIKYIAAKHFGIISASTNSLHACVLNSRSRFYRAVILTLWKTSYTLTFDAGSPNFTNPTELYDASLDALLFYSLFLISLSLFAFTSPLFFPYISSLPHLPFILPTCTFSYHVFIRFFLLLSKCRLLYFPVLAFSSYHPLTFHSFVVPMYLFLQILNSLLSIILISKKTLPGLLTKIGWEG